MTGLLVALGCRALVAGVFVLTATWKVSNRQEFESSFERLAPRAWSRLAPLAVWPVAAVEVALTIMLLAGIRLQALSLVGPAAAFALVAAFTVALALGEEGGCGCWTTPQGSERVLKVVPIFRNLSLLIVLAAAAILSPHAIQGVAFTAGAAPFVTGLIMAVLLVETPQIVGVLRFDHGPERFGEIR